MQKKVRIIKKIQRLYNLYNYYTYGFTFYIYSIKTKK